jgi:hypothetical protein
VAIHPVMLNKEFKYAGLTLTESSPISRTAWPLAGGLLILGMALITLPDGTRRRAIVIAALALGLAAASVGCGGSSSGPTPVSSTQELTGVSVTADGKPAPVGGVPASLGTIRG